MTDKTEAQPEALRLANNRPHSLDDDLYAWALSAEYAIREQHVEIDRLRAQLVAQTNRAAAAEQQVTALTQRLDTANNLNTEARNQLAQLSAREAAPDGWKLVPVNPTEEMLEAAHAGDCEYSQRAFGGTMHMPQAAEDHWHAMLSAAPPPPEREPQCWCETCDTAANNGMRTRMSLCPTCGNKRCPRSNHHDNACTNSNAPGQPGSSWEHVKPHGATNDNP